MKRLLSCMALAAAVLAAVSCGDGNRENQLKIYNWSSYIDEALIGEFEEWYEEQTGEKVSIVYQTFDINETMLSKIEKGHEDYDIVCPSDYIIERMLRADLLIPIDRDFGDTPNYIDDNVSPFIKGLFDKIDGSGKNANDYTVGYMWGTTGILYNARHVDDEDATTWDILRNEKYRDKIFVKDAARDVYGPVLIYLRQEQLKSGETTLDELMYDSSDESIADVENYMKQVKELVAGWEADFGKEQMTQEKGYVNMTWSGDAVWAIEEAAEVDVDLRFAVPDEGSNVWFDGWVIPKYARNVKAARYFINFLCMPENAIRNMDEIGYVSTIGAPEVLEAIEDDEYDAVDLSYFFGPEATEVHTNAVQYPDRSTVENCTLMHDWGEETPKLIAMWSRVKGDNASPMTYIVIGVTFCALLAFEIGKRVRKARRRRHAIRKKQKMA